MDEFKKTVVCKIGPGGLKCSCCNGGFFGKTRKFWSRLSRRKLKAKDKKDFNKEVNNGDE